ncbi:MAG: glycosyltransferase family 39 protein [bacterium]|nr:glycosyltransferase family 39 protein [bacterium]
MKLQEVYINKYRLSLALILSAVFLFHLPGLFYGFPFKDLVGDEVTTMSAIFKMFNDFSLRPDYASFYHLPFAAYAQLPFYALLLLFLRLSGLFASLADLKDFVILNYGHFLPFARFLTSVFAVGAVYLIYLTAEKIFKRKIVAIWSSLLLGFNFMFFQVTHFARVWALQIFILLAALYAYLSFFEKKSPGWKDYFFISLVTALSFGVHLIGAFVYIIFLILVFIYRKDYIFDRSSPQFKSFWLLQLSFLGWAGLFYYLNPGGFLIYFQQSGIEKAGLLRDWGFLSNLAYYAKVFFNYDLLLAILIIPAGVIFWRDFRALFWSFAALIVLWISSISYLVHPEPRFIVALMPFLILPSSYFMVKIFGFVKSFYFKGLIAIMAAAILFYLPFLWTIKIIQPNTLVSAGLWINGSVKPDGKILNNNPYLALPENKAAAEIMSAAGAINNNLTRQFIINALPGELPQPRYFAITASSLGDLAAYQFDEPVKFEYLILSFWNNKQQQEAYLNFPVGKQLLARYYPTETVIDLTDMANNLLRPYQTLWKVKFSGPYLEIYKLND